MKFKDFLEGKRGDIARLQPNTVVTCFHGTDMNHAYEFCINGIDAKHIGHYRVYKHTSGKKNRDIKFGIFIAPSPEIAFKFGSVVVKFKTLGKNLTHMFPAEMKKMDQYTSKRYPNSFRPSVSDKMLDRGPEPQALFIGLASPRSIEQVYIWEQGVGQKMMSREEFIAYVDKSDPKAKHKKSQFEPQEYQMSLMDFAKRVSQEQNHLTPEQVLDILKRVYQKHGQLTGLGYIPFSLRKRIESQLRSLLRGER